MTALILRFLPLLAAVGWAVVAWQMSARQLAARLNRESHPLREPSLAPIIDRMSAAIGYDINVNVHETDVINGLAAPDGRIFLTEGFLKLYRQGDVSDEEIASVIAHELGHVALGHSRRRMIDYSGQTAVGGILAAVMGRFIPVIGRQVAGMATTLLAARMSRNAEFEADEFATALLLKAGINPAPQISLFEKLPRLTGAAQGPAWFSSHPHSDDRIARIRSNLDKWHS